MKNNRKGFTTVELVIVIAVIAILAAVLIPTFSNLITKANDSAALQTAKNAMTAVMVEDADPKGQDLGNTVYIVVKQAGKDYVYTLTGNVLTKSNETFVAGDATATPATNDKIGNTEVKAVTVPDVPTSATIYIPKTTG